MGGLALGRARLVLPPDRVAGDDRAHPARAAARAAPTSTGTPAAAAGPRRPRAGAVRASPSCASPRSPTRSTSCCPSWAIPPCAPVAAACSCSSRHRVGGAARRHGLVRRGCPTAGTWEQARAGWPVVVGSRAGGLGARAPAGGRGRARCARRRLPGGERPHLQRGRRRSSSGPAATGCPASWRRRCHRWRSPPAPAERRRRRRRGRRSGRGGPSSSGSIVVAPTRAAACSPRSSSAWPGPSSTMPTAARARPARLRLQPHRRRPPAGLPPLRRAGLLRPLRRRGRPAAGRGAPAVPALRRDAARSCARPAAGCA